MPDRRLRNRLARRLTVFGPAGIVVLTGVLAYVALGRVVESRGWVQHTHDVLDQSSALTTSLLDAETAVREYVLTHDSAMLAPYQNAPARVQGALDSLRQLAVDNPRQVARIDTLGQKIAVRLAAFDTTVAMDEIRRLIDDVKADEQRLLVQRQADQHRYTQFATAIMLLGTLTAGMLAFMVSQHLDRALRERRVALDDANTANERLQETAIELEHQADAAQSMALEAEQASEHAREALVAAEEAERRAERLQAATEAFTGALEIGEVANLIVDQAMHAVEASSGALATLDADAGALCFVAVRDIPNIAVGSMVSLSAASPACEAVRGARPLIGESEVAFPLLIAGQPTGALLVRFDQPHALDAPDRALLAAMSRIATETVVRARLFEAERDARTAAEAANRAKAAFLASMSHELRTPLQAALGFAQLVRSGVYGAVNEQQSEVLGRVERSQMHLSRLIDDILDFARLEAGRVRVESEPVVLADVIDDLAPLVEPQAVKKGIELSLVPPSDALAVRGDRHRVQQILVNLVGNAIKFTPENGMIQVGAQRNGTTAIVSIRDTGRGIPADRLQAIFEPFVQVEDSLTRTASGVGLGLAISRDLARAMGGDLMVESELGKGSTFSIVLPLA